MKNVDETALLKQHDKWIRNVAVTFRNSGIELDELKQEARIAFLSACRDYRSESEAELTTLAFRYIVNSLCKLCRAKFKTKKRKSVWTKSLDERLCDDDDRTWYDVLPVRSAPLTDIIDAQRLLSMLSSEQREIVERVLAEESVREIGKELHMSKSLVHNRYKAALQQMKEAA